MKRFGIILYGLALIFGQPLAAQTQTSPTFAPNVPNKSMWNYTFKKGSGVTGTWSGAPQVGPYIGHTPTGAAFTLYCVDQANYIWSGYKANVLVSNIGVGDISGTRLDGVADHATYGSSLDRYQKSAYLASLYFANMGSWSPIQAAIWTIMTPSFLNPNAASDGTNTLLENAQAADLTGFDFSTWNVLTPYKDGEITNKQEMVAQSVVPEPQTYLLLFSGLIFMVFFGRRRMKEMGYL